MQGILQGGSSPPMWGIRAVLHGESAEARFIPTYVGYTSSPGPYQFHISVHPHIRGAYLISSGQHYNAPGSSPHTWGILIGRQAVRHPLRFIPTYVGHTRTGRG